MILLYGFLCLSCIPTYFFTDHFLKFINWMMIQTLLSYSFYHCGEDQLQGQDSDWILLDVCRSVLKVPFQTLRCLRICTIAPLFGHGDTKNLRLILLGCVLSIPLLCIIVPILMSADLRFAYFISSFFFDSGELIQQGFLLLFSFLSASYLFLIAFGTSHFSKEELQLNTLDLQQKRLATLSMFPSIALTTVECILALLYLLFLCISMIDIVQNFNQSIEIFSYASFARQGFFQLCAIAMINLCILFLIALISKKEHTCIFFKRILCVETLLLIVTALSKIGMYMTMYGLTTLRIYATWFLIVLFGIFCLILYRSYRKGNLILPALRFACLCFFLLHMSNPNGLITYVNHQLYLQETTSDSYMLIKSAR